jgi:hypothetical protein
MATVGQIQPSDADDHLDCQQFHQERGGMVQRIPFHEDAQHHRWCKENLLGNTKGPTTKTA